MLRAPVIVALALATVSQARAQEPARPDGWVVIPVDEYRALRLKAYPPDPPPDPPPVPVTLSRVDYDLRVNGDSIGGEARLTVDVLKDGWVAVPIGAGFFVRGARVDGRAISVIDDPTPHILFSKRGRALITLDVIMPLKIAGGSESITIDPAWSAVARVGLVVPRRDIDLTVSGGVLAERPAEPEKPWVAYASAFARPLTMTWKKRVEDARPAQATRFRGSVIETVGLGEETGLVTANARVEVTQGVASAVNFTLPDGVIVNQVSGPLVGDWEFKPGALKVSFLEPCSTQTTISINAEIAVAREGAMAVPLVRMAGAERETGGIAVEVLGAGEITDKQARGLDPADPSDLGDALASRATPSMIAFRYRPQEGTAARSLNINVLRYTPQAVLVANVEEARYDALLGEEGKIMVRARYAVTNNQRAFLGLTLPARATLWSAAVAGRPLRPGAGPSGGLLIPLLKGRSGEESPAFIVEVTYVQRADAWTEDGRARLELPTLDLPVSRTGLSLHYSPRYKVTPERGAFHVETDTGAFTDALRRDEEAAADMAEGIPGGVVGAVVGGLPEAPAPPPAAAAPAAPSPAPPAITADKLISDFRKQAAGRSVSGVLPVRVVFPEFGPRVFLASELTPEGRAASVEVSYKRDGRWSQE